MHRKAESRGNERTSKHTATDATAHARMADATAAEAVTDLDFEALDLSIETVEERISPSETNVFDK